ncbi:MAG TPA: DUF488 domain-containing protein [Nitrospira sp.]|nr:DUF488 domain-containing protein [Nitrospira sp.]
MTTTRREPQLWTIGHSTKPIEDFLAMLRSHGIQRLVDVRTIPRSRHNPQYDTEALAAHLKKAKLTYRHMPQLGGLKKAKKDSVNAGWKNASFRGYADYMQSEQFRSALEQLMAESREWATAVMCAEAVPWRCHRSLIADALLIRGWVIRHIMTKTKADTHRLTPFAVVAADRITYPSASPSVES